MNKLPLHPPQPCGCCPNGCRCLEHNAGDGIVCQYHIKRASRKLRAGRRKTTLTEDLFFYSQERKVQTTLMALTE